MDEDIGLAEVVQSIFNYQMQGTYTALPGVVLRVINSGGQQLIDVQPCVSLRNRDGTVTQQAPILNVPYQQPASSVGGTVFPVAVGDNVLLVFQMRGIDTWKYGQGGLAAPSDYRMFSNQDCVAIPCISPVSKTPSMKNKHSGDYEIGDTLVFNGGTEVIIKPSGDVIVNAKNATMNISDTTKFNTNTFEIACSTYKVTSSSYQINSNSYSLVAGSGGATTTGNMNMTGSFVLNGIPIESHGHIEQGDGNRVSNPVA